MPSIYIQNIRKSVLATTFNIIIIRQETMQPETAQKKKTLHQPINQHEITYFLCS